MFGKPYKLQFIWRCFLTTTEALFFDATICGSATTEVAGCAWLTSKRALRLRAFWRKMPEMTIIYNK
jgi:hypothetical protein